MPMIFFLTARIPGFILPITVRLPDDAMARLEAFLTSRYLIEITGPFSTGGM
jgi:hypothetical protein